MGTLKNVKKRWIILTVILLLTMMVQGIAAAYPCSTREKPSDGVLLEGELFGTEPYGGNQGSNFRKAWDGDRSTFFDPSEGATDSCYTGVMLDGTYILTQIRILPRSDFLDRFDGAEIQGSNDGDTWETVWVSKNVASAAAFNYISPESFLNNEGYSMFRYVNRKNHGDVAEIELYGYETDPPVSAEELAAAEARAAEEAEQMALLTSEREEIAQHVLTSPSSGDRMVTILIVLGISGTALIVLSMISLVSKLKKKKEK